MLMYISMFTLHVEIVDGTLNGSRDYDDRDDVYNDVIWILDGLGFN